MSLTDGKFPELRNFPDTSLSEEIVEFQNSQNQKYWSAGVEYREEPIRISGGRYGGQSHSFIFLPERFLRNHESTREAIPHVRLETKFEKDFWSVFRLVCRCKHTNLGPILVLWGFPNLLRASAGLIERGGIPSREICRNGVCRNRRDTAYYRQLTAPNLSWTDRPRSHGNDQCAVEGQP